MDMNWKKIAMSFLLAAGLPLARNAQAQTTYEEMEQLTVNEQITTVITASEPVRFVDISTDKVAGDQPIDNIIRLKPKESGHEDGEILAIVTIVTERYRTQYALIYTTRMNYFPGCCLHFRSGIGYRIAPSRFLKHGDIVEVISKCTGFLRRNS